MKGDLILKTTQKIAGWRAIVTGGGSGIGRGIAVALAREGVRVAVCGRRQEPLQGTVATINDEGGEGLAVVADVSQEADVSQLVQTVNEAWGGIDILVNNAGVGGGSYFHNHDIGAWDRIMAVNLRGPFLMARAVLPEMRRRQMGHIINISSESGIAHYAGNGAYGVSKHALNAMGEIMQRENQEFGIRVNTICPGMVVTEMSEGRQGLDESRCLYPEDIADLVLWLLCRRPNTKIGLPVLIQTMENPWQ